MRKHFIATPKEIAVLDELQRETGASHSELIRRALLCFRNIIFRKITNRKRK